MKSRLFGLATLVTLAAARPSAALELERLLVPIAIHAVDGAYGSKWDSRVVIMQEDFPQAIVGGYEGDLPPLPVPFVPAPLTFPASAADEPPGLILHAVKGSAVHVAATVLDLAHGEATSLPVVSSSQFSPRAQYFIDVRRTARQRITLRVYSLDVERGSGVVTLRIGDVAQNVLLTAKQRYTGPSNLPLRPLATQLSIDAPADTPLVISVTPQDGLAAWSFLSITSNDDQHTRIVLPQ